MGCNSSSNPRPLELSDGSEHSLPSLHQRPDRHRIPSRRTESGAGTCEGRNPESEEGDVFYDAMGYHGQSQSGSRRRVACSPPPKELEVEPFEASSPPSCCQTLPPHSDPEDATIDAARSEDPLSSEMKQTIEPSAPAQRDNFFKPQRNTSEENEDQPSPLIIFGTGDGFLHRCSNDDYEEEDVHLVDEEGVPLRSDTPDSELEDASLRGASITSATTTIRAHAIAPHELLKWARLRAAPPTGQ